MSHYNDRRYKFVNTRTSDRSGVGNGTRRTDRSGRGARPKRMAQEAPQPNSCTAANIRLGSCRRKFRVLVCWVPLYKFCGINSRPSSVRNRSVASFAGDGGSPRPSIARLIVSSTVPSLFLYSRNKEGALATWRHEGNIRRPY